MEKSPDGVAVAFEGVEAIVAVDIVEGGESVVMASPGRGRYGFDSVVVVSASVVGGECVVRASPGRGLS